MECKSCLLSFSRKSKLRFTRRRPLKRAAESSRQCLPRRQAANHVAPPPPGGVCLLAQARAPVLPCVKSFLFATLFFESPGPAPFSSAVKPATGFNGCDWAKALVMLSGAPRSRDHCQNLRRGVETSRRCLPSEYRSREFWPRNCPGHVSGRETVSPKQGRENSLKLHLLLHHSRDLSTPRLRLCEKRPYFQALRSR